VGFSDYPTMGPTHSAINGKKLMELFVNIASFFPKDGKETVAMVREAYLKRGPAFISLKTDPCLSRSITGS